MTQSFIEIESVSKLFTPNLSLGDRIASRLGADVERRPVRAVDGIDLSIAQGETLGLVGESGCGKSTLGRIIAGILSPTAGSIQIDGKPVMVKGRKSTTRVQTVFQDPFASLDPRMRIGDIIAEGPKAHGLISHKGARNYVAEWLELCGLSGDLIDRFPHQFSGGQRQRIAIARALAMKPDVLVCDEPVASLDVSIQAQIINLFLKLRRELGLTSIFISHDLSIVRHVSDTVAIMYLGRIVETGSAKEVYATPRHPYTIGLMESVPRLVLDETAMVDFKPIKGEIPSPTSPPPGCRFHPRCPISVHQCHIQDPKLRSISGSQCAACHLAE